MTGKTLQDLIGSAQKPAVTITIFEGPRHRGHLLSLGLPKEALSNGSHPLPAQKSAIKFQPADGAGAKEVDWAAVKAIHFVKELEGDQGEENVRFFDSAAIPPYLWVRVEYKDKEVIEGMLDNSLSLISGPCLVLFPLDPTANQECVCIPRAAIANLQVITFRR